MARGVTWFDYEYRRWPGTCARGRTHHSPATWYLSANTHSVTDPCGGVMHNCTVELICLTGTRGLVAGWLCLASIPSFSTCCTSYQKHSPSARSRHDCDSKADAHRESRALHLFLSRLSLPLLSPSRRRFTVVAMLRPSLSKCRNLQAPTSSLVPVRALPHSPCLTETRHPPALLSYHEVVQSPFSPRLVQSGP